MYIEVYDKKPSLFFVVHNLLNNNFKDPVFLLNLPFENFILQEKNLVFNHTVTDHE